MSYTGSLFNFINNSTSSFHTVLNAQSYLIKNGFEEVNFSEDWQLKADKKYFTKIYDSTLIALDVGIPILAMHSARETMGKDDQKSLEKLVRVFFEGFY